jgi:hypothetical protein
MKSTASRFALPAAHAWQSQDQRVRLVEQQWRKNDPDPKALACYGILWQQGTLEDPDRSQMWLRFVTGRPVSAITIQFLEWCCKGLQKLRQNPVALDLGERPPFIRARRCGPGSESTISRSSRRAKACGSCPCCCPRKAPGSTRLNPSGCTASGMSSSPMGCFRPSNWPSGSVPTLVARMNRIWLFPNRSREFALALVDQVGHRSCSQ